MIGMAFMYFWTHPFAYGCIVSYYRTPDFFLFRIECSSASRKRRVRGASKRDLILSKCSLVYLHTHYHPALLCEIRAGNF